MNNVLLEAFPADPARVAERLHEEKQKVIAGINLERDRRETVGFSYLGKMIDSDPRSVQRINTAVQAAQAAHGAGQTFSIEWTCADNSTLMLDGSQMIAMPLALAIHGNTIHQHAKALKALVDQAVDMSALQSIDILAGWPE